MINHCEFTDEARADLGEIHDYIASGSPTNALLVIERLEQMCYRIADAAFIGRSRDELASGLRSFPVGNYVIFYRPIDDGVEIVRVLHGSRDVESQFQP